MIRRRVRSRADRDVVAVVIEHASTPPIFTVEEHRTVAGVERIERVTDFATYGEALRYSDALVDQIRRRT